MKVFQFVLATWVVALGLPGCVKEAPDGGSSGATAALSGTGKAPPPTDAPLADAPAPKGQPGNPLVGAKLFVDPESNAMGRFKYYTQAAPDPAKAALIEKIAFVPQALWMGEWNTNIFRSVEHLVERAQADDAVAVFIAYNVPHRDCGQYSQGGVSSKEEYRRWIREVAAGIGSDPAVVILEPDALGHFQECLSEEQKRDRMFLLNDAVRVLRQNPRAAVYLDAGHARWVPAEEMAERLKQAGIEHANGFSLNVSNYVTTEENLEYGRKLSSLVGGKHFVIDTSRNGAGPYEQATSPEEAWCNPPGRRIGELPTTDTGEPLCDAFLWLKRPGESDGECRGGPKAGVFWDEIAFEQAK
jgi:endoglucanase